MLFEGIAQGIVKAASTYAVRLTKAAGSVAMAQVEAEGDELTRHGARFHFGPLTGVTGIAPVQAIPTTAAQWLMWNPANSTVTQFIDELGVLLVSGTAGAGVVLLAAKVYGPSAPTPANTPVAMNGGIAIDNRGRPGARGSSLVIASGQTLAAGPACLFPIAKDDSANTAILSVSAHNPDVRGKIAIPPGTGLALYVTSPAGTSPLFAPFGTFHELAVDLE
jgi:hypothetical protein